MTVVENERRVRLFVLPISKFFCGEEENVEVQHCGRVNITDNHPTDRMYTVFRTGVQWVSQTTR